MAFSKLKAMKTIKYELIKISEAINASAGANEVLKETDTEFPWITGIMLHSFAGAGTDILVGLESTSNGRVINYVPLALLNLDAVHRNFNDQFIPVNIPAGGDALRAIYKWSTITTAVKADFVLRLEKEPRKDVKKFQLQHKELTVKAGSTSWSSSEIVVIGGYKKIKGVWINTLTAQRVAIKASGNYILEPVPCKNLTAGIYSPYNTRFFPMDVPAPRIITVDVESLTAPGADIDFDMVLLME